MNRKWFATVLVVALLQLLQASNAFTQEINFDDLEDFFYQTTPDMPMPYDYAGLNWFNFNVMRPELLYAGPEASGFYAGMISPHCIVYNQDGEIGIIESSVPFNFESAYLTAAWKFGLQITVQGFLGSELLYTRTVTVDPLRPTSPFYFDYVGVDKVTFTAFGGTASLSEGTGSQFVMDDVEIGSGTTIHVTDEVQATIDIKPGSDINPINPTSKGVIPVAILWTEDVDPVALLVPDSLTFGRTGDEQSLARCAVQDVDNDGHLDLICHFYTAAAGFVCGDTVGYLKGTADGDKPASGSDAVQIVPCKKP